MSEAGCSFTNRACRVCFEDIDASEEAVQPCECMEGGVPTVAHRACIQKWISLRPNLALNAAGHRNPGRCEVCSTPWKQSYELPQPPPRAMTREEFENQALQLLLLAYARTQGLGGLQPRSNDAIILRELGPHFDGPWRKQPSLLARLSKRLPSLRSFRRHGSRDGSMSSRSSSAAGDSPYTSGRTE